MVDKLNKRPVGKINYFQIIKCLNLSAKFLDYLMAKKSTISLRRSARCFCLKMHINYVHADYIIKTEHIKDNLDLAKFCNCDFSSFYNDED